MRKIAIGLLVLVCMAWFIEPRASFDILRTIYSSIVFIAGLLFIYTLIVKPTPKL